MTAMNWKLTAFLAFVMLFSMLTNHKESASRLIKRNVATSASSASTAVEKASSPSSSNATRSEKKHRVTFFQIQDYRAPKDGSQSYSVGCSNATSGIVEVTDVGRSWGSVCASGGNMTRAVCKNKGIWSPREAANKVCSG